MWCSEVAVTKIMIKYQTIKKKNGKNNNRDENAYVAYKYSI